MAVGHLYRTPAAANSDPPRNFEHMALVEQRLGVENKKSTQFLQKYRGRIASKADELLASVAKCEIEL